MEWLFRDCGATLRVGGGHICDSILGGMHKTLFLTNSLNFKHIGGGGESTCPPLLRSPCYYTIIVQVLTGNVNETER